MADAQPPAPPARAQIPGLVGWVLLCFGAAAFGGLFSPGAWYAALNKPAWNPPNWVFGPVWTTLYLAMAVAVWLVWRQGGFTANGVALRCFLTQLALNALWTPLFFGLKLPGVAFAELLFLWLAIAATLIQFWRKHRVAGLLLTPYLAWVTFAGALNFTLWRLNR